MIDLFVEQIEDSATRENFRRIVRAFKEKPFLKGDWRFVTITFTGTVTNFKYAHGLSFTPKDVIQTSITGSGAVTWNYSKFDKTNVDITVTGTVSATNPTVVRALVGIYTEGQG